MHDFAYLVLLGTLDHLATAGRNTPLHQDLTTNARSLPFFADVTGTHSTEPTVAALPTPLGAAGEQLVALLALAVAVLLLVPQIAQRAHPAL